MDAVVIHGGLGTTAEALRVGIPIIITGSMLMDQRYWGARCFELGVSPPPCHINEFPSVCVDYVDRVLKEDNAMALKAKEVARGMHERLMRECEKGEEVDVEGVRVNVRSIVQLSENLEHYDSVVLKDKRKTKGELQDGSKRTSSLGP
eukprot:TRINITY_DN8794_c0_g1_i1.p1 TRINITY_DN8794_c0_g1~~TRINITY_DN8794_c0_g1_i1.p1  ORF type:complete len:148 (-),score=43.87 TRINITY_DN8794_c0_g1_i1:312-755(-)